MFTNMEWHVNQYDPMIKRGMKKKVIWETAWVREDKEKWDGLTKAEYMDEDKSFDEDMKLINWGLLKPNTYDTADEKNEWGKNEILNALKRVTEKVEKANGASDR